MTSLMLIISFLLHIIALFAIYQLFQKIQSQKKEESTEEVMEMFEIYLDELKKENDRLLELIDEQGQTETQETQRKTDENLNQEKTDKGSGELDELLNELPVYDMDTSLESKVLQLHSTGMGIEDIARNLNCGKTEAELIIKIHGNK